MITRFNQKYYLFTLFPVFFGLLGFDIKKVILLSEISLEIFFSKIRKNDGNSVTEIMRIIWYYGGKSVDGKIKTEK